MDPVTADGDARPDVAEGFTTGGWEFTKEVAYVFPEHVRASVPHYEEIQKLVAEVADWTLPAGGVYADLGASTGETLKAILARHPTRKFTAALYDEAEPMLARAKTELNPRSGNCHINYYRQQIQDPYQHEGASLTTCLFTLQFMSLTDRIRVLELARAHSADTGTLIIAEKIRPVDSRWAEIANDRSHDWKAEHGIDDAAIRAKARALRGVLIPQPESVLRESLTAAGWRHPEVLFCWHSWLVIGAFAR